MNRKAHPQYAPSLAAHDFAAVHCNLGRQHLDFDREPNECPHHQLEEGSVVATVQTDFQDNSATSTATYATVTLMKSRDFQQCLGRPMCLLLWIPALCRLAEFPTLHVRFYKLSRNHHLLTTDSGPDLHKPKAIKHAWQRKHVCAT